MTETTPLPSSRPATDAPEGSAALLAAARAAQRQAYAPYSGYRVGAAVRDEQGRIHAGCNVENAAYPEGLCAEAAALAAMVLAGGRRAQAVVVLGEGGKNKSAWTMPCGGCRQKLREFGGPGLQIQCANDQALGPSFTLAQLLPESFGPEHLNAGAAGAGCHAWADAGAQPMQRASGQPDCVKDADPTPR